MNPCVAKPVLSVDLDEVLSDTYSFFTRTGAERGLPLASTSLYHPRHWFTGAPEEIASLTTYCDAMLHHAQPVPSAMEAIRQLSEHFDLVVVTGRSEQRHQSSTAAFLDRYFKDCFRAVRFCDHWGAATSKSEVLREMGAVAHVDDLPEFVLEAAGAGIPVLYLNRRLPWQTEIEHPQVLTVRHWKDLTSALLRAEFSPPIIG